MLSDEQMLLDPVSLMLSRDMVTMKGLPRFHLLCCLCNFLHTMETFLKSETSWKNIDMKV